MSDRDKKTTRKSGKKPHAPEFSGERLSRLTAPPELEDDENRQRWGLGETPEERGPYMVELNVQYVNGLAGAASDFRDLFKKAIGGEASATGGRNPWGLVKVSKSYFRCHMNIREWKTLIAADEKQARGEAEKQPAGHQPDEMRYRIIYKLWPDFPVQASITRSLATIKADAALRSFEASGDNVTWAVIDSGVDALHAHFGPDDDHVLNDQRVRNLHRCFVEIDNEPLPDPDEESTDGGGIAKKERDERVELHVKNALEDPLGHGTHVAGIIAGRVPKDFDAVVLERDENSRRRRTGKRAAAPEGDQGTID